MNLCRNYVKFLVFKFYLAKLNDFKNIVSNRGFFVKDRHIFLELEVYIYNKYTNKAFTDLFKVFFKCYASTTVENRTNSILQNLLINTIKKNNYYHKNGNKFDNNFLHQYKLGNIPI